MPLERGWPIVRRGYPQGLVARSAGRHRRSAGLALLCRYSPRIAGHHRPGGLARGPLLRRAHAGLRRRPGTRRQTASRGATAVTPTTERRTSARRSPWPGWPARSNAAAKSRRRSSSDFPLLHRSARCGAVGPNLPKAGGFLWSAADELRAGLARDSFGKPVEQIGQCFGQEVFQSTAILPSLVREETLVEECHKVDLFHRPVADAKDQVAVSGGLSPVALGPR